MEILRDNLIAILVTILSGVASYIGLQVKAAYTKYVDTKTKKEIVKSTVAYVEQVASVLDSKTKYNEAKQKALEWLNEKGIKVSETELEILIESAVNNLKGSVKK